MATTASLPCLIFDHGDEQRTTTLYSVSDGARRPFEEMEEELRGKRSWVTSHGWLLLWDPATLATFLWDPRAAASEGNSNKIALQPWASPPEAGTGCALSGEPTDPDGFTVVVLESSDDTALWYCHTGGTPSQPLPWARHEYDIGGTWVPWDKDFFAKRYVPGLAACRGKFYCDVSSNEYGVLEFSPEPALTLVKMEKPVGIIVPPGQCYSKPFAYTLDLDGEVHTVWIFFSDAEAEAGAVIDVVVYRMDLAGKRSVRVESIGDRAILAAGSNCDFAGWCPATESGLLPNSVYWVHPYGGRLYVYDVGANTKEVRELGEVAGEPSRLPFWIVPRI